MRGHVPLKETETMDDIFEACVDAVNLIPVNGDGTDAREAVKAVLDTIIALTPSPRTVDELTRIRGAGE